MKPRIYFSPDAQAPRGVLFWVLIGLLVVVTVAVTGIIAFSYATDPLLWQRWPSGPVQQQMPIETSPRISHR